MAINKIHKIGESSEDYLETILELEKNGKVRSVDIAREMNVSKPSVNKAMNVLKDMHYITQEDYGDIHLTDEGRYLAQSVYERHVTLTAFFNEFLGVEAGIAEDDACHVEHVISKETFDAIKALMIKEHLNKN